MEAKHKTALVDRILAARAAYRDAARIIRRVRRLYMAMTWAAILADNSGKTLDYCARRMIEAGMYSPDTKPVREVRFAILRRAWRRETGAPQRLGHPDSWHNWYPRQGFSPFTWERNRFAAA